MFLLSIFVGLVIAGSALWLININIPMDVKIRRILNVVVVIVLVMWLLDVLGVYGLLLNIHSENLRLRR